MEKRIWCRESLGYQQERVSSTGCDAKLGIHPDRDTDVDLARAIQASQTIASPREAGEDTEILECLLRCTRPRRPELQTHTPPKHQGRRTRWPTGWSVISICLSVLPREGLYSLRRDRFGVNAHGCGCCT
jgi:hypothetical protein